MAQPVWVLSVDLQTKTATFQTGLADAAKAARGSFGDIKGGAGEMGGTVNYSMMEARHSVMMLGEEFGVHLPRALTSFIASIGPLGAMLEAAFPFLAIALGATLLIEHLVKMHEAGEKLTEDQVKFGTAVQNAFNTLDEKILQARIRTDELRNDHLGALRLQLELIDRQSMKELVHSFEEIAKAADVVMKELEGHWYTFGKGSDGAKHALDDFQTHYVSLLAQGKNEAASGLLHGTAKQAQEVLQALQNRSFDPNGKSSAESGAAYKRAEEAAKVLQGIHVETGITLTKQIEAQQNLVDVLQAQLSSEQRIADLKKLDSGNAGKTEGNAAAAQAAAAGRQAAESQGRMGEQSIAAERAAADALLTIHRASLEQRLASDIDFAGRTRDVQLATNAAELAGLDKNGKDYANQVKALKEKALEIGSEYDTKIAELSAKASVAEYSRDLTSLEQSEREKIEATRQGSAQRLTAIDAAIKQEEAANLQDTNFFRELLNQRVQTLRQEAEEEGKLRQEAAREGAESDLKMGEMSISAEKQRMALEDSARRVSAQRLMAEATKIANEEYAIKMAALQKELTGLDKSGKDYENKLKQIQGKEKQLTQQHVNELSAIKQKAEEESNQRILSAENQRNDAIARGLTSSIMGHQSWAKMLSSLGDEVVSGTLQNAIKSILADDMTKERDAAKAARKAYNNGMDMGPAGVVIAPVWAAAAFATVMAFEGGGVVPGIGRGDVVPAMLSPGEGIVPGGVMDGLSKLARSGGMGSGGTHYHAHVSPVYNLQAIAATIHRPRRRK
jgi:hypothetical protein